MNSLHGSRRSNGSVGRDGHDDQPAVGIPIPRRREVNERTTEGIYREGRDKLGKGLVTTMSTYTALVSRDGRFWHVEVPEIDRVTQARTINEVDDMARDLIAIMTGLEPGSVDLDVRIQLPDSVRTHL